MTEAQSRVLLKVRGLTKHFPAVKGQALGKCERIVRAVDGLDFDLYQGECLALVGESGSGKTTAGRAILRALKPTGGEVIYDDGEVKVDLAQAPAAELKDLRRRMQMIFQDPYASLNPRMTVFDIIGEPLLVHGMKSRTQREERVRQLLEQVGLKPQFLRRYPHAFSGGQRQRIGIARALALNPTLIVADEPVSALDVSVQAQVLNLLQDLQAQLGLSYLFIAHDLSVIGHISDRVAVMYVGKLVELAPVDVLFSSPSHPYTEALLGSVPVPDPAKCGDETVLLGEVADPADPPPGCLFHPRCPYAEPACSQKEVPFREVSPGHFVRCRRAESLNLAACKLAY